MRPGVTAMMALSRISLVSILCGCAPLPNETPPAGAEPAKTEVYYATLPSLKGKVRLSDEMSAKLIDIVNRKPFPFDRGNLKADPRGYFIIGEKAYSFYGNFIASDPQMGDSWIDPVFDKFWDELNRAKEELSLIEHFKP